ncbi:hypothetical protein IV500_08440 [Paeniglutamicibacter antarcticus]|uniref:Uncharacterized protein n=1 Tax=Arthrobacter terrae TaxID=2935737 RepID=A0A931CNG6_9MICC|nr:hypothetical protein [Arthrobacter terrae]
MTDSAWGSISFGLPADAEPELAGASFPALPIACPGSAPDEGTFSADGSAVAVLSAGEGVVVGASDILGVVVGTAIGSGVGVVVGTAIGSGVGAGDVVA